MEISYEQTHTEKTVDWLTGISIQSYSKVGSI